MRLYGAVALLLIVALLRESDAQPYGMRPAPSKPSKAPSAQANGAPPPYGMSYKHSQVAPKPASVSKAPQRATPKSSGQANTPSGAVAPSRAQSKDPQSAPNPSDVANEAAPLPPKVAPPKNTNSSPDKKLTQQNPQKPASSTPPISIVVVAGTPASGPTKLPAANLTAPAPASASTSKTSVPLATPYPTPDNKPSAVYPTPNASKNSLSEKLKVSSASTEPAKQSVPTGGDNSKTTDARSTSHGARPKLCHN